jgi:hypothetical protein
MSNTRQHALVWLGQRLPEIARQLAGSIANPSHRLVRALCVDWNAYDQTTRPHLHHHHA